jgi:TolB-like protein
VADQDWHGQLEQRMPKITARQFGGFELKDQQGNQLTLSTRKARGLLAFLIAEADKWHARERLAGLLWSDRQQAQARHSFSQALSTIRKLGDQVGVTLIESDIERVRLPSRAVDADTKSFRECLDRGAVNAADHYLGTFLDGFAPLDAAFDEWLATERARFHEQACAVLIRAIDEAESGRDLRLAISAAKRWVALDPCAEAAHQRLMRLYVDADDRAEAIRQYKACATMLREELDVEPSARMKSLLDEARAAARVVEAHLIAKPTPPSVVTRGLPLPDRPSVAVMPFTNLSADPEQELFADGIAEDIVNALSKISKLRTIARYSTFAYKGKAMDVRKVARDLDVQYVLEGSTRRAGERLRVTAQLVDAQDGAHIWAERFDRQVEDLFDIQDAITKEVVTALRAQLTDGEEALAWARGTNNIEAWQYCVRAVECQDRLTPTHHIKAREFAKRAVELDPNYAYAWAILGLGYFREARLNASGDHVERLKRAAEIAEKAMGLDDTVSWAVGLSAMVAAAQGRHDEGLSIIRRAIELHPGNADMRAYAGFVHGYSGEFDAAIEQIEIGISLNPFPPLWYRAALTRALALSGAYEEAMRIAEEVLCSQPDNFPARFFHVYALQQMGRDEAAYKSATEFRRYIPHFNTSHIADFLSMRDRSLIKGVTETMRRAGLPE